MGKLLKYEFRKTRFLKIILLIIAAVCELNFFMKLASKDWFMLNVVGNVGMLGCAMFALVATVLYSIYTFYKELNSKKSYMLFMTPNNSYKILGAKSLEIGISMIVIVIFATGFILLNSFIIASREQGMMVVINKIIEQINMLIGNVKIDYSTVATTILETFVSWLSVISIAIFSIVVQATVLNGKKFSSIICILLFAALSYLMGLLSGELWSCFRFVKNFNLEMIILSFIFLVISILFYIASSWLMDKKLSV